MVDFVPNSLQTGHILNYFHKVTFLGGECDTAVAIQLCSSKLNKVKCAKIVACQKTFPSTEYKRRKKVEPSGFQDNKHLNVHLDVRKEADISGTKLNYLRSGVFSEIPIPVPLFLAQDRSTAM